jgi:hypothetical protein
MKNGFKLNEKLVLKKQKYLNEKSLDKWDNLELSHTFSNDQIQKVLLSDKSFCQRFILPKEQREIHELFILSSYLTESLLTEMERVKTSITH